MLLACHTRWERTVELPYAAVDATLRLDLGELTFVTYLYTCFRWAGFPGWARLDNRPEQDIAHLTADLLPL